MNETAIQIIKLDRTHYEQIKPIIKNSWGSEKIISCGKIHYLDKLPGLIALKGSKIVGFLIYRIENKECEIMALNSLIEKIGIGTLLLKKLEKVIKSLEYETMRVATTNDNTTALQFYQKKGFKINRININAMEKA